MVTKLPDELAECTGFEWDDGNADKNWELHQVSRGEAEDTFFNKPFVIAPDLRHSKKEPRYAALGVTSAGRKLTVIFTVRRSLIRIISVRDMSRQERRVYDQASSKK